MENVLLTKKQRQKLKRNVLHRYHDLGERLYTSEDRKELVEGTGISSEIVEEETEKIVQKNSENLEPQIFNLESQLLKEDLKKFGRGIIKGVLYPIGVNFTIPTMARKAIEGDYTLGQFSCILGPIFTNMIGYSILYNHNPKIILPLFLTQVGTNLVSGIYEYMRKLKERVDRH